MTVSVRGLTVRFGERSLFNGLDATFAPGLHWVTGDEGSGKSTLLAVLAGRVAATAGEVDVPPASEVFLENPVDRSLDGVGVAEWLQGLGGRYTAWNPARADELAKAYGLQPHLSKPFFQLSAGSRRKAGLLAAAASGAALVLLDGPFAALDVPSQRTLARCLSEVDERRRAIWVVADYEPNPACPVGQVLGLDAR